VDPATAGGRCEQPSEAEALLEATFSLSLSLSTTFTQGNLKRRAQMADACLNEVQALAPPAPTTLPRFYACNQLRLPPHCLFG